LLLQLSGVGGTTQHYYGNSPRAMPGAFAGYGGADAAAYDVAVELLRAAGARAVQRQNMPPTLFHPMSTMRMGHDPADSVCDENGAARAVRHLYIADNSVLANALGGPNPTLTTQGVATRTAGKIFTLEFGGDPWVGREAPVSSIDPVVTEAVSRR
jgi:choline dehydrogenase-like flavoprotein